MRAQRFFLLLAIATASAGCEAVPDIQFVEDDASARPDGDSGRRDGQAEGGGTCSAPAPAGGTCCGAVWCLEQCDLNNCDECARKGCLPGQVCCGKTGTVQCRDRCAP